MVSKICFASVDVEKDPDQKSFRGIDNIDKILSIFKKYDIPATLFVTGEVLQKYQEKFQELAVSYEIACHSFTHRFWNTLNSEERQRELNDFINLYQQIFQKKPLGFRAPSHIIDADALSLLKKKGFLYDSSVLPHYPPFKKYRGYQGRKLQAVHFMGGLLESPVAGQIFGIPLAGAWIRSLPLWVYRALFLVHRPHFLTLNMHSWEALDSKFLKKLEKIIQILKNKRYQFLNGEKIYQNYR